MREPQTPSQPARGARDSRRALGVVFLMVAVLTLGQPQRLLLPMRASASTEQHNKPKQAPQPKEQPTPSWAGETLTYRVSWSLFANAASLELSAPERRTLFGWETWHFRGVAHTLNSVRTLFPIDDQFDSYTDAATLDSRQFETHLNELGRSTNQILHFSPAGKPASLPPPIVFVPLGTRDPLGAVYALRGVDWHRTPQFRAPVYDGRDLYEILASLEAAGESVKVAAGTYSTWHISIRVFQNQKEVSAVHYVMWIASDGARTPVLLQAELPFGQIRAELTSRTP